MQNFFFIKNEYKKYNENHINRLNNKWNLNNYDKPTWNNQIENKNTSGLGAYWNGRPFPYEQSTFPFNNTRYTNNLSYRNTYRPHNENYNSGRQVNF